MPTTVTLPSLGESIVEGIVDHWIKQPGDEFQAFDPLVEVITDKVNAEVPAPMAGKLLRILAQPGETVAVGAPIAEVEVAGEVPSAQPGAPLPAEAAPEAAPAPMEQPAQLPTPKPAPEQPQAAQPVITPSGQAQYSPSVMQLAQERGIDLSRVRGTGMGGRVTRRDVLSYVEQAEQASALPAPALPSTAPTPLPPTRPGVAPTGAPPPSAGSERVGLTNMRRLIAENMARSKSTIPHAWQVQEVDMSRIAAFRAKVKDDFRRQEGVSLSYVPFVIKAACESLRENPRVNAQFDGDAIILHRDINIGVAVGTEDALIVPVIHQADSLSLAGIARALNDVSERARRNKLKIEDVQGATFTVNNVGTFGTVISYSIINPPQAGILTMEAVVDRVVVVDGMLAIRPMMFLCFSFDHRVLDGLQAARFLSGVRQRLEGFDPETAQVY